MKKKRKIIEIDEEKCTGCGQCILACAEGALALVDGKAKLIGDVYCDGLGACIGECPEGALTIVEKDAEAFTEQPVHELQKRQTEQKELLPCGCPSSMTMALKPKDAGEPSHEVPSQLGHWPIKLQLLSPNAPFLKGSNLLLLADCAAAAFPNLHSALLKGKSIAMGCPKLDDIDAHIDHLADIIRDADLASLTVVHMEVPCCFEFVFAAQKAIEKAGVKIPLARMKVGRTGEILEQVSL
jgi:ferredoxin